MAASSTHQQWQHTLHPHMSSQQLLLRRMVVEVLCLLLTALGITQPQLLPRVQMEHNKQMGKQQAMTQLQQPSQVWQTMCVALVCSCFST